MKSWLLLLLLVLQSFISWAEPLYPLLNKLQVDSLKNKLKQTSPNVARVDILLRLSNDLIAKTKSAGDRADSAYAMVRQAQVLSKSLHFMDGELASQYSSGWLLCNTGKPADGQKIIQATIDRSRQQHDISQEALGWYYLGIVTEPSLAQLSARLNCFAQAARCYGMMHDLARQAYCLKNVADMHYFQGKYLVARQELLHVETLYRRSGTQRLQDTFDLLMMVDIALGNYGEALKYGLAAIQSATSTHDDIALKRAYTRLYIMYHELNQLEKADEYLRLQLQLVERIHDYGARIIRIAFAQNLLALGRPKQGLEELLKAQRMYPPLLRTDSVMLYSALLGAYVANKHYKLAAHYCQQLSKQVRHMPDVDVLDGDFLKIRGLLAISRFYVATHRYAEARAYTTQVVKLSDDSGYKTLIEKSNYLLFKVDSAQYKLTSAIADFQRYTAARNSILTDKNNKQLAGLQIQYDTKAKEQSIALLTKQSLLQQMTIRQRGFQRNAFVIGTALLVLVLGLGYNRYRLGQRSNRLLEEKQQLLEAQQAEISQKNQSLEQVVSEKETLLTEKEWMLKEIHHRVKNNLQVISSLLTNQSNYLRDPLASAAIRESRNRVQAMALIHQRLYQADTLARVNMAAYVREIVNSLLESFDRFDTVTTQLNVAAVELEIALATPLGLIVNEAVTNVLKYAFPPAGRGTLTIVLTEGSSHHYRLTITDDGVGLPPDFDLDQSHSLGLIIIKGLSTQIGGDLRIESANGVRISLQFEAAKSVVPAG
jgi:two-component sensor histidine kinase